MSPRVQFPTSTLRATVEDTGRMIARLNEIIERGAAPAEDIEAIKSVIAHFQIENRFLMMQISCAEEAAEDAAEVSDG